MDNQALSQNIIVIAGIALALGAGGGYYAGQISAEEQTAKEVFGASIPTNVLSGTVARVDEEKSAIFVDVPGIYGLNFPARYRTKEVHVSEGTRIVGRAQKDGEELQKEFAAYRKELATAKSVPTPPLPHTEEKIELRDIKPDDRISFSFSPRENTTFMERKFSALDIIVQR